MKDYSYIPDWTFESIVGISSWGLISQYMGRVIRSGNRKHIVRSYSNYGTRLANAYFGGVLAPNGRIYFVPFTQATATYYHYIDTKSSNEIYPLSQTGYYNHKLGGSSALVSAAYRGGVLTPNGKIWLIPSAQSTATTWHYINTNSAATSTTVLPAMLEHFQNEGTMTVNNTTINSFGGIDGVIDMTSITTDPRMFLTLTCKADPTVYKYLQFKIKYISGTSDANNYPQVYFLSATYPAASSLRVVNGSVNTTTGSWVVVNINMSSHASWTTIGDITGIRFDFTQKAGMRYQIDYIALLADTNNLDPIIVPYRKSAIGIANAYAGGLFVDNKVYFCPYNTSSTSWHYIDTTTETVTAYTHNLATLPVAGAYEGCALSSDGKIYFSPLGQATATTWHYINTTKTPGTMGHVVAYAHAVSCVANAYSGAVTAPDGKIYFIPYSQSTATLWHYIDITGNVVAYTHGASCVANAYIGGSLAPDGKIYFSPYNQATATTWHYIDTTKTPGTMGHVVAYSHNQTGNGYAGSVVDSFGRVFLVNFPLSSSTATTWHYIDTMPNVEFQKKLLLSPYMNKF